MLRVKAILAKAGCARAYSPKSLTIWGKCSEDMAHWGG